MNRHAAYAGTIARAMFKVWRGNQREGEALTFYGLDFLLLRQIIEQEIDENSIDVFGVLINASDLASEQFSGVDRASS